MSDEEEPEEEEIDLSLMPRAASARASGCRMHPEAREVVARYIDAHGDVWSEEGKQWLQRCRDGTVM